MKPILTFQKVSVIISLTRTNCELSQEASVFHNVNSINCFDVYQCFLHLEAPPHKLIAHIKRQTWSLQISQVWQTHLSSKYIDIFHLTQQSLYFPKDQNFYIPGGSFQNCSLVPSWRNMFENWSYLSYFPSLTQNINGHLKKEFRAACLLTSE